MSAPAARRVAGASRSSLLYWRLGRLILDRQDAETYGTKVIERLAADLRVAFPEMRPSLS